MPTRVYVVSHYFYVHKITVIITKMCYVSNMVSVHVHVVLINTFSYRYNGYLHVHGFVSHYLHVHVL